MPCTVQTMFPFVSGIPGGLFSDPQYKSAAEISQWPPLPGNLLVSLHSPSKQPQVLHICCSLCWSSLYFDHKYRLCQQVCFVVYQTVVFYFSECSDIIYQWGWDIIERLYFLMLCVKILLYIFIKKTKSFSVFSTALTSYF